MDLFHRDLSFVLILPILIASQPLLNPSPDVFLFLARKPLPSAAQPPSTLKCLPFSAPSSRKVWLYRALNSLSFRFFLFGRPFKTLKSEGRFEYADGSDFQEEESNLYSRTFKGLSPSITPFGKRKFVKVVDLVRHKTNPLSMPK